MVMSRRTGEENVQARSGTLKGRMGVEATPLACAVGITLGAILRGWCPLAFLSSGA